MRTVLAFLAMMLLFPVIALAGDSLTSGNTYIELKGGQYRATGDDFPLVGSGHNVGSNIEISVGRRLFKYLAVEATYGRFKIEKSVEDYQFFDATYGILTATNVDVLFDVYPMIGTAKFTYPVGDGFLYVGGGLGQYKIIFKEDSNVNVPGIGIVPVNLRDEDTVKGWHAMVGTILDIGDNWSLGLEYKEVRVDTAELDHELMGVTFELDMDGRMLSGFAQYRFW